MRKSSDYENVSPSALGAGPFFGDSVTSMELLPYSHTTRQRELSAGWVNWGHERGAYVPRENSPSNGVYCSK
jgi:hypothetical protein